MKQENRSDPRNEQTHPSAYPAVSSPSSNDIILYQTEDGEIKLDVKTDKETVWLTQAQMSELFQTDRTSIVRHINNIYKSHELEAKSTCAKIAQVRTEGKRSITRYIPFYNLDMIISVGYRVNSKRGTQFRIWANKILKDYLLKGYALDQKIQTERYQELKKMVRILGHTLKHQEQLTSDQSSGLLAVVTDYVYALDTLDKYDYQQLLIEDTTPGDRFHATYENAMEAIRSLKGKFGEKRIADNTLVALTLMIAESRTEEKDSMVKVIVNLINQKN